MGNSKGRERNGAQPLGERQGTSTKKSTERTAAAEQKSAGPDGPSADEVAKTFKR